VTKGRSSAGTLDSGDRTDETLRLFLALVLPHEAADALERWRDSQLLAGAPEGVRRVEGFHITLAFLGSRPSSEVPAIVEALRESALETAAFELVPKRYRETRTVGMVVLDDPSGEATRLAERLHGRLERLGVYQREARQWLPHTTVVRFRQRPRLVAPTPDVGAFTPSEAAAFVSRLHRTGARYEILERCVLNCF
jgi:RNA 2',3'-cyclic 3'-phosphodiesterase